MADRGESVLDDGDAAANRDKPVKLRLSGAGLHFPTLPSPKKQVFDYGPNEFEEFVEEWVPALNTRYVRVERHGGTGDHGVDVAAYLTPQAMEGEWHNYQCKHYGDALTWSKAAPEIRKLFASVVQKRYTLPSRYIFAAPIIGRSLVKQFARPSDTRAKFLAELSSTKDPVITSLSSAERESVVSLAQSTDFSMFEPVNMDEMLDLHKTTRHWADRFTQPLPPRPQIMNPPDEHTPLEARYIQKLLDAYREEWGEETDTLERVAENEDARDHLNRQREAFYSAESLRVFARDATPEGHFEAVLDDIHAIVVEVARGRHPSALERLQAVLVTAGHVALTETILAKQVRPLDRKGVCHHLANDDRLTWRQGGKA
ncbi:ABC-three component system protein [Streptomyces sp. NPDC056470]|uniref:ABC-three component system protein n=1 Tax=unclassified Streptomyces TaxID=2593676 RepID=UPI003679458D